MTDALEVREAAQQGGRRWVFGSAELDEQALELRVGGQLVPLEPKPVEVLLYLLRHAGEVVTKDDLAENLWPGRILTETVLTRCISLLRTALQDDDRSLIRTVHGYGYRLVARVKVETSAVAAPPKFDFKAGDTPPTRPQWRLVERLGTGGHGEAWLARHEKTGDARVFKFALDVGALASLKREITLYRLVRDSLGARAAVVRILEWNLEEPPYFIEMEYVAGGNLQTWSEAQGGLSAMPLPDRLELVAQIAEALAGAHSVGALHKDLKPGNVLVAVDNGRPAIRLCDFGSGTVLDPQRLEALGITRLGFTKTLAQDTTSATPLYIAPEVIAGQPFTVQADIYALGILLYQMVTGDLRRALAPGWEADIEDELLREDIAAAAAGNPARRLTDASQLAERLRTREQRREARAAEVAARQRAERVRRIQGELRRTRVYALGLLFSTVIAVAGGVTAYRAGNEAKVATATAKAISEFLMEDVLRMESGVFKPSEPSYEALLDRASREVHIRLKNQPAAEVSIHSLLGRRYQELGRFEQAQREYEQALGVSAVHHGEVSEQTLLALDRLGWIYLESGRRDDALDLSNRLRALWTERLSSSDLALLVVKTRTAKMTMVAGGFDAAEEQLRDVIRSAGSPLTATPLAIRLLKEWLGIAPTQEVAASVLGAYAKVLLGGNILEEFGDGYRESESLLREAQNVFASGLGDDAELTAIAKFFLAIVVGQTGRHKEAEILAVQAQEYFDRSVPQGHYARGLPRMALGLIRIEQRRPAEARALLEQALDLCGPRNGCPPRHRFEFLWGLGRAYNEEGRGKAAITVLREASKLQQQSSGNGHISSLVVRVSLVEALLQAGAVNEASAELSFIDPRLVAELRPYQKTRADFERTRGLLLVQLGQKEAGISSLQEALDIVGRRRGVDHWRTARARAELEAARESHPDG